MADAVGYQDSGENFVSHVNLTKSNNSSLALSDICLAGAYCAVFVLGVTGNTVLLLAIALSRKLQTRTSILIISLSVSDLLVSTVQPFQVNMLLRRINLPLHDVICQLTAALDIISIGSSIITIALIALNRCVLIIKPLQTFNRIFSTRHLVAMVIFSWLYPIIAIIVLQVAGHGFLGYDALTRLCICDFSHKNANTFAYLVSSSSAIALSVSFLCYWLIFRRVKKSATKSRSSTLTAEKRRRSHSENVITKNLLCVVCCFLLCVSPFLAVFLAIPFLEGPALHRVLSVMPYVSLPLVLDSCLNPFIYGWKHPHFRVVMACILRGRWRDIPEPSRLLARFLARNNGGVQTSQANSVATGCEAQSQNATIETNN
ncbi:neuropeptides B/W receptor type 1-like [Diadema setosum]|uniref:neuropeptides B/W receptor type 1-like n=1 Tax=Diadema setosum TaxID=31175 RepID=UPI003B3AEABD